MSGKAVEDLLARLYSDADALERFKVQPRAEALKAGLSPEECDAVIANLDWRGVELAARNARNAPARRADASPGWLARALARLGLRVRVRGAASSPPRGEG